MKTILCSSYISQVFYLCYIRDFRIILEIKTPQMFIFSDIYIVYHITLNRIAKIEHLEHGLLDEPQNVCPAKCKRYWRYRVLKKKKRTHRKCSDNKICLKYRCISYVTKITFFFYVSFMQEKKSNCWLSNLL